MTTLLEKMIVEKLSELNEAKKYVGDEIAKLSGAKWDESSQSYVLSIEKWKEFERKIQDELDDAQNNRSDLTKKYKMRFKYNSQILINYIGADGTTIKSRPNEVRGNVYIQTPAGKIKSFYEGKPVMGKLEKLGYVPLDPEKIKKGEGVYILGSLKNFDPDADGYGLEFGDFVRFSEKTGKVHILTPIGKNLSFPIGRAFMMK